MAVTLLNGKIIAIGGKSKPDDCLDIQDPAYGSFPVNHVNVLLNPGPNAEWVEFEKFHDEHFCFAAAVVPAQNCLYTFGGQLPFDFTCNCFPTSDLVGVGTEVVTVKQDNELNAGAIASIVLGSISGAVIISLIICKISQKRNKETMEKANPVQFEEDGKKQWSSKNNLVFK